MEPVFAPGASAHVSADNSFENLIRQAQAGDQSAFSSLYESFRPRVAKFLYNATGDYCLVDELTNDTFLRAHRALPNLQKCREASFLSFLFRIGANLLCDHHRGKHLPTVSAQEDYWDDCPAPENRQALPFDSIQSQERAQMLRQALDQLPPDQAALISLAHFDQLSAEQILPDLDLEPDPNDHLLPVWGWKTSGVQHFNDDAVFGDSPNPEEPPLEWNELRYPSQHPFAGQSIDLAFVITPEPATLLVLALGLLPVLIGKNRKFNKHS